GTRLGTLSDAIPKPLVGVAGKPFIQWLVEEFRRFGFKKFLVLAGHLGDQIKSFFDGGRVSSVEVNVLIEPEAMGTGGALRFASPHLDDIFMTANADSLFSFNLLDLALPPLDSNRLGRLALRAIDHADRYGVVKTEGPRITGFLERGDGG